MVLENFLSFWLDREYEKGKGFKQFRRLERFTSLREQADGSFDPYAIQQALDERASLFSTAERDDADWTPLGPFHPYPGSYVGGMGRVNATARTTWRYPAPTANTSNVCPNTVISAASGNNC